MNDKKFRKYPKMTLSSILNVLLNLIIKYFKLKRIYINSIINICNISKNV